jgi:phosphate:Na+ symporter
MEFGVRKSKRSKPFASQEIDVIAAMHAELFDSLRLAVAIFLNDDERNARRLVERKSTLRQMENQATALHVRLLRDAAVCGHAGESDNLRLVLEESGVFLRIVSDLRRVHSHLVTLAYPVLSRVSHTSSPATAR